MTKGERDELAKILKARARLAGRVVEQRAAELLAEAEQQLATVYKVNDQAWRELTATAQQTVREADAELARRCRTLGIPEEFRPHLTVGWWGRGENGDRERRAELRKVAQSRIATMAKSARVAIETQALEGLTQLAAGALESEAARAFLAAMPTPEALMPALDVTALGPLALRARPAHEDIMTDEAVTTDD
jgi:outer membrane scaffolding protein for murein synthesis (MipA/OmpV family)